MYNLVKHACDQNYGIISQCFRAEKLERSPNGYFENLLLKVNGKIGGQNTALESSELLKLPFNPAETMLVGMDVNHPGSTERVLSSVAAAVGSYDKSFSQYNASITVQKKERDEMVISIDTMMTELLNQYHKVNNVYPKNVIIFRDGVSDGQFNKVLTIEIPRIESAFRQEKIYNEKHMINLTVIIVQKRHHARFALSQEQGGAGGRNNNKNFSLMYNVPSGTVVDQAIVDPRYRSFYINSHFSPLVSLLCVDFVY